MVKNYRYPSPNIEETCVILVVKLLRNDCEKLRKVEVSTACSFGNQNQQIATKSIAFLLFADGMSFDKFLERATAWATLRAAHKRHH